MRHNLNKEDFIKSGIYTIKNILNNKIYIGSTKNFRNRFHQHSSKFKNQKHHNPILQNIYNKYGKEVLYFEILEITDNLIERETYYINFYNTCNKDYGYNINPFPKESCSNIEEVKIKISKTLKNKYEEGTIQSTSGCFKKGNTPWNKGYVYKNTDYMKVPKTITKKLIQAWENSKKRGREKANLIEVYDKFNNLLYTANSLTDLEEWSVTDSNFLPINSRFGKKLTLEKVCKACKSGKSYKGLFFKSIKKPLINES